MLKEFEFFHGAVFANIFHGINKPVSVRPYSDMSNSSYVVNEKIGIYIKYSSKRLSPWRFSFRKDHQDEIQRMKDELGEVCVVLVCNDDGIVALTFLELKAILNDVHQDVEWVSVARNRREMYLVKGKDGQLPFKIGRNEITKKLSIEADAQSQC